MSNGAISGQLIHSRRQPLHAALVPLVILSESGVQMALFVADADEDEEREGEQQQGGGEAGEQ